MNINGTNYKVQNQYNPIAQIFSKSSTVNKKDNFNPNEWTNTNGMKGMYIGDGNQ